MQKKALFFLHSFWITQNTTSCPFYWHACICCILYLHFNLCNIKVKEKAPVVRTLLIWLNYGCYITAFCNHVSNNVSLQACVPLYQRRTASTLRISSRLLVWRTVEASSQTALAVTGAQPAQRPTPPPTATGQAEGAPPQMRARRRLRETNGTAWSPTSVMTSKLSGAAWTRREWRPDRATKGSFVFCFFVFFKRWHRMAANPQTDRRHEPSGSDEGGP